VRITRFVVTTRRIRFTGFLAAWRLRTTFLGPHGVHDCTVDARAFGTSAICIAPLPISAPPQVQAQSLARAIRTDIYFSLFPVAGATGASCCASARAKWPKLYECVHCVNCVCLSVIGKRGPESRKIRITVPNQNDNLLDSDPLVNLEGLGTSDVTPPSAVGSALLQRFVASRRFDACVAPWGWL